MSFTHRPACALFIVSFLGCSGPAAPTLDAGLDSGRDATRTDLGTRSDTGADSAATPDAATGCQSGCNIVEAVAGFAHTCARRQNGEVLCWGRAQSHELGIGTRPSTECNQPGSERESCSAAPYVVNGLNDADQIAAHGAFGACARSRSRGVLCWGANVAVVGGMSGDEEFPVPTAVAGAEGTVAQEVGVQLHCVIVGGGAVHCRGHNEDGELGGGNALDVAIRPAFGPVVAPVRGVTLTDAGTLDAAMFDGAVPVLDGSVSDAEAIDSGVADASPAVDAGIDAGAPVTVDASSADGGGPSFLSNAVQLDIAIFGGGACARLSNGALVCWGNNESGRLGDGRLRGHARCGGGLTTHDCSAVPVYVTGFDGLGGSRAVDVAVGASFACAADDAGRVWCWGSGPTGTLGNGARGDNVVPEVVAGLSDVVDVSAGGSHTCARRRDGHVFCWGSNEHKQLGDGSASHALCTSGSTVVDCALSPVEVQGLSDATSLVSGFMHTCALSASRGLVCWGWNRFRQLGEEDQEDRNAPTAVPGL